MNGSCATSCMPNARARCATSWPMRPRPATPSVLPRSSVPRNFFFSHRPSFIARSAAGTERASASISAHACSATLMLLAPGALTTSIAARAGGRDVDVVDAGAGARDDAQARRGGEQLRVDLGGAADQQRVGVGQIGGERRGRASRSGRRRSIPLRRGAGPAPRPAGRRRRQSSLSSQLRRQLSAGRQRWLIAES